MKQGRALLMVVWLGTGWLLAAGTAQAKPAAPEISGRLADLSFGVFCAVPVAGRQAAPGTLSGWIHVPEGQPRFDWPGQRHVPAVLGIGFGVTASLQTGGQVPVEVRVFRPGQSAPETLDGFLSATEPDLVFFRFDTVAELVSGLWAFEAWDGATRLYRVEFEVVPAARGGAILAACGATS